MEVEQQLSASKGTESKKKSTREDGVSRRSGSAILHQDAWQLYLTLGVYRQFEPDFLTRLEARIKASPAASTHFEALQGSRRNFEQLFHSKMTSVLTALPQAKWLAEAITSIGFETSTTDKKANKKWQIRFVPNVAVFYRGDSFRIPPALHSYMRPKDVSTAFTTFEAQFKVKWPTITHVVGREELLQIQHLLDFFLIDDGIRYATYNFCRTYAKEYDTWKKNPKEPFGHLLDNLVNQFPFNQLYEALAKLCYRVRSDA